MKKVSVFLFSILLFCGCGQFVSEYSGIREESIERLFKSGEYDNAENLIKLELATGKLTKSREYDLRMQLEVMERIKKDFSLDDSTVIAQIKKYYPGVTPGELSAWERSGALECMMINGRKRYFRSAAKNLFRISKEAQSKYEAINGRQSDGLDLFLSGYIPQVVKAAKSAGAERGGMVMPVKMKIKYSITVPAGEVPEGEIIRVWMPYPRNNAKHKEIKLLSTSQPDYIISPESYGHKSIYMEQPSKGERQTCFGYELSYTSYNVFFEINPDEIKPYNKESELYRRYTAERETHIIFSDRIRRLTDSIVAGEQNPYLKCVRIFDYISQNYPWASAREYSTIENIPEYVLDNRHGDCGEVTLLFFTMARYAGIPAKWQSGWMMHPGEVNLHDWGEVYFEGVGWVPVDQSFGPVRGSGNDDVLHFYTKGLDGYRFIVNDDFSAGLYPAKIYPRSETVDFQRGEVEWRGENLYFDRWRYNMEVEYKE